VKLRFTDVPASTVWVAGVVRVGGAYSFWQPVKIASIKAARRIIVFFICLLFIFRV
jgi:hypothetical protein